MIEIFKFFIFFRGEGKVATFRQLLKKFIKIRLTFPGGEISSLKNLFYFHIIFFFHWKFIKFLDTSQGRDIDLNFYILHLDILISESSRMEIIKQIIF